MTFNPIQLGMELNLTGEDFPSSVWKRCLLHAGKKCNNGNYFGPNRAKDQTHQRPTVEKWKLCKINIMSK